MRDHTEDRPSTRTLVTLTVTYVVAAGCHAALAVVFKVRWHGVLMVAASGLLAYTAFSARIPRSPVLPPPRQRDPARGWDAALEELVRTPALRDTCDDTVL